MNVLISYELHESGNYIVHYGKQKVVVLPGAFRKLARVSDKATVGTLEIERNELKGIGFIIKE